MSYKVFITIVCTTICATCLLAAEHDGNGSADQSTQNLSTAVTIPRKVLEQLIDITYKSKGLIVLWSNAVYLKEDSLLRDEVILHLYMHTTTSS